MSDALFSCPISSQSAVTAALVGYSNVLGPLAGNMGKGAGDSTRLYYNVRPAVGQVAPSLPAGCTDTDAALSEQILGTWA